jgi:hypothetical protein
MHPGSTNSRPDPKAPIDRHSLTDGGLAGIYERYQDLANVGGGSAKDVGTSRAATNVVDIPNKFSKQFQAKNPVGFTVAAEKYSTDVLKVPNTKYAPGGRL